MMCVCVCKKHDPFCIPYCRFISLGGQELAQIAHASKLPFTHGKK